MKANEIIQRFEESLNSIPREELLKLVEEINAMEQEEQISMEEYFTMINQDISIKENISVEVDSFSYSFDYENNQAQTFDKNILLAA